MKLFFMGTLALALAALSASQVQGYTNPIVTKGSRMFDAKTGESIAVKGIDYYPRPNAGDLNENNLDFFTDDHEDVWVGDIEHLVAAGANAVRLYAVDPSKSHDKFMCALRKHGMYALVDLASSCENCAITKHKYPECYPAELKSRGEQIISEFAQYDNVLGFSAGNEVNNIVKDANTNAPCQKKFIRDMRAFIGGCASFRNVPVGVVMADPDTAKNNREVNSKYYNCRTDEKDVYENVEWYGLNTYQYCDGKVTELKKAKGFYELYTDFKSYDLSIPIMLSEYGCVNPSFATVEDYEAQRTWLQAGWLFESTMRDVFAGGFVFEYITELSNSEGAGSTASDYPFKDYGAQNYGLGYYSPEDCDHMGTPCKWNSMPNYNHLTKQYKATDVSDEASYDDFSPDSSRSSVPACPSGFTALADVKWEADDVEDASCPSSVLNYKCPGQKTSDWTSYKGTTTSAGSASANTDSSTSDASVVGASFASACLLAASIATLM